MVYETPTTKEQMYEILKQIYYDYRMKIDGYEDAGLTDLILDRMEFTEKTEEELALEREERDADREQYLHPFDGFFSEETCDEVEVLHGEVAVFVVEEKSDADGYGYSA